MVFTCYFVVNLSSILSLSFILDKTTELLPTSQSSDTPHVIAISESKESEELVLPAQIDSSSQDTKSDSTAVPNVAGNECGPSKSNSFILSKTNDIKQIKGWQEKLTPLSMTQEDNQNNVMIDLPSPLVAVQTDSNPLRTDAEKETENELLDSVVNMGTDILSATDKNDLENHSTSDSAVVTLSAQIDEETLKADLISVEESQGIEELMPTTEKSIFASVEENKMSALPEPMETEDEETRYIHVENAEGKDEQLLTFQMETEAVFSHLGVEAGDEKNAEHPSPSPTDAVLLVPESATPSPVNGCEKYPDLLDHASTDEADHSLSIPPELSFEIDSSEEDTKEEKVESKIPMQLSKVDLKELTKRLAEVSHCHEKESAEINYKVK